MSDVVILDATRTPIGKYGGTLKDIPAVNLGAHCIKTLVERNKIPPGGIDNVLMGMVVQAGAGQIPSRQCAIKAGIPAEVPSMTINKVCASGMRAATLAATMIRAGEADLIIAGGIESMSRVPYASYNTRWGMKMGDDKLVDLMVADGLWCAFDNVHMAIHGNTIASKSAAARTWRKRLSPKDGWRRRLRPSRFRSARETRLCLRRTSSRASVLR